MKKEKESVKETRRWIVPAIIAAMVFMSCPNDGIGSAPDDKKDDPNALDGPSITGTYFTAAPILTFTTGASAGEVGYRFTAAQPADASVTYMVYIIAGQENKSNNIINVMNEMSGNTPDTDYTHTFGDSAGEWCSAVVVARHETAKAVSGVQQVRSKESYTEQKGAGKFVSVGPATAPGTQNYYIDYERGSDSNTGKSPSSAWKTFRMPNRMTFNPGDRIFLEANSIWNGTSVTPENYQALSANHASNMQVGMLAPRGSGTDGNPIVIDLYEFDTDSNTVNYSSNRRPIINGNGTPSIGNNPYLLTGAITLVGVEQWEVYNIEVTNSFDFPQLASNAALRKNHWLKSDVIRRLVGIYVGANGPSRKHIVIKNCYVHDVQSENPASPATLNAFGTYANAERRQKISGGIAVQNFRFDENGNEHPTYMQFAWSDILLEGNIIKRVGLTGIRNTSNVEGEKIIFRGNYIESVGGDGFVLTRTKGSGENQSKAEYNIIKDSCADPYQGTRNYAAAWAIYTLDTVLQYNEVYGNLYGYIDGEAFDFDGGCQRSVYQYNYSHHNQGGAMLFMGAGQANCVFRYNISANDGGGARYVATVTEPDGELTVDTSAPSYTNINNGESIFHFASSMGSVAATSIPLIYNNTIYVGDGITTGIFGELGTGSRSFYARFFNNILIKEGAGTIYASYSYSGAGNGNGSINSPNFVKNNIFWAYNTDQNTPDTNKMLHAGSPITGLTNFAANGNKWVNPQLKIQTAGSAASLRTQRDTVFPEADYNDPAKLAVFTGKERLRNRASLFSPTDAAAVKGGMYIPKGSENRASVDSAWNDDGVNEDFFGNALNYTAATDSTGIHIGAAVQPYTPTASVTD